MADDSTWGSLYDTRFASDKSNILLYKRLSLGI